MGNVKPAHVCPAGVDLEIKPGSFENNPRNQGNAMSTTSSLFFIGSLDWIPNQEGLLWFLANVYPLMHRKFPSVKMHVAGRNASSSLIKKLHLPGVIFHGEVADAREFAKAHRIFIAPCFSGSGMRLKIIEAMAFGRPVITTPIGAEGLNVKHDENILIADNATDFGEQIERLMNNPELYLKITQNAISFLQENYININLAAALAGFYETQLK
jgi:glycosyltransferase involved in cell wall biosynthesis